MAEEIQQVQTPIDTTQETTLETIEAIWTSSRKIIIWRQTRQKIYGESGATYTFVTPLEYQNAWTYHDLEGTGTVSDEIWELSYNQQGNWMRLPLQSSYSLTITPASWRATAYWDVVRTTRVLVGGKIVYTYDSTRTDGHTDTITITAWKFAVVTVESDISLPTTWSTRWTTTVVVQKL